MRLVKVQFISTTGARPWLIPGILNLDNVVAIVPHFDKGEPGVLVQMVGGNPRMCKPEFVPLEADDLNSHLVEMAKSEEALHREWWDMVKVGKNK